MMVTKLYVIFLWIVSFCTLTTVFYMTSVSQIQLIHKDTLDNKPWNCSCKHVEELTTQVPRYNYTKFMYTNSTNKTSPWKLVWPEKKGLEMCKISNLYKNLVGRIDFPLTINVDDIKNAKVISKVKYGGIYRPPHCISSEKVAVIIPYRDRAEQLDILVHHLHNMLQRQQLYYGIFVVEMALPVQFNRGLLANTGFLTAKSIGNFSCYIIHDVDLLPVHDHNLYKCSRKGPTHLVTNSSKFENGQLPYKNYVGGVIALSTDQFYQINGFSNLYFGWGGEDDDLFTRMTALNMTLQRPAKQTGLYLALPHSEDSSNPPNPHREALLSQSASRINFDGLSSLKYNRKALEFRNLYTWILIECSESELLERFPFLRADSDLMKRKRKQNKYLTVIKSGEGRLDVEHLAFMDVFLDATTIPKIQDCYTQPPGRGNNNPVRTCVDKFAVVPGQLFCQKSSYSHGLEKQERNEIENKHNEIRSGVTPKAGNMLTVSYNRGLERTAHIWAQKCELKSSEPLQRFRPGAYTVGENVYLSNSNLSWSDVIDKWAEEKSAFTFGSSGISLKAVSNFIQLVWAKTSTVGCSKAICAGQYFYVCQYAPAMDYDNYSMPYESSTKSCARCIKNCSNSLCECGGITCLNGGELNVQTCQCECIAKVNKYELPLCELLCEKNGDDPSCGKVYQKSTCKNSFETLFHCPWMCDLCPYAGTNYTERSQPLPWERNRTECPEHTTDFKTTSQNEISTNVKSSTPDEPNGQACGNGSCRTSFPLSIDVFIFILTLFCIVW